MSQDQLACQLATNYQQAHPNHQSLEHSLGTAARRGAGRACCGQGEGAVFQQQEHVMPVQICSCLEDLHLVLNDSNEIESDS